MPLITIKRKLISLFAKAFKRYCYPYYILKSKILSLFVGQESLAYVLYSCLYPEMVLKIGGAKIGKNVRIHRWLILHESKGTFENLEICDDVFIGKSCIIDLSDKVKIGNRCSIGMAVKIITHNNAGDSCLSAKIPNETSPVEIMDDSIINWGAIIIKGTLVKPRTVVFPGSVVSGVLKEDSIYCGNPARVIPQKQLE